MKFFKHLRLLKLDWKAETNFILKNIYNIIHTKFSTFWCKMQMTIKGINYGHNIIFRGNAILSREVGSTITIGNNCKFLSSSRYNYRGINHCCIIQTGSQKASISIGNNCGFSGCSIVADLDVKIGNNVMVGTNSTIGDRDDHTEIYATNPKPVIIKDGVWIGMNCIILKGVTIGENSIIGAGSVVTHDIPANVIAAGVPARKIKDLKTK